MVGLASGLVNLSAVIEAENNSEGSGARLLHYFEAEPQRWAMGTLSSFLLPQTKALEIQPWVSLSLVVLPFALPLQLFFAFMMPAKSRYSAILDAYFKATFIWFYAGALISVYLFAPTIFIWSAYTACFTFAFSLALRIPYLMRLSRELAAVHEEAASPAEESHGLQNGRME